MTVQPFLSCVVVTVLPFASVAEAVDRAVPPPRELEDTLTDELEDTEDELIARAEDRARELLDEL